MKLDGYVSLSSSVRYPVKFTLKLLAALYTVGGDLKNFIIYLIFETHQM